MLIRICDNDYILYCLSLKFLRFAFLNLFSPKIGADVTHAEDSNFSLDHTNFSNIALNIF